MQLEEAKKIAEKYVDLLKPFCYRVEIAGSIRREKPEIKDIEIVVIPKDLAGLSKLVNSWKKIRGEPTGRYTQRILPEGIKLDLFIAFKENWGNIFAIRTGSAEFSWKVLAKGWVKAGYKSVDGFLRDKNNKIIELREEKDLFDLIGLDYIEPAKRY